MTTVAVDEDQASSGNYSAETKDGMMKLLRIVLAGFAAVVVLVVLILGIRTLLKKRR